MNANFTSNSPKSNHLSYQPVESVNQQPYTFSTPQRLPSIPSIVSPSNDHVSGKVQFRYSPYPYPTPNIHRLPPNPRNFDIKNRYSDYTTLGSNLFSNYPSSSLGQIPYHSYSNHSSITDMNISYRRPSQSTTDISSCPSQSTTDISFCPSQSTTDISSCPSQSTTDISSCPSQSTTDISSYPGLLPSQFISISNSGNVRATSPDLSAPQRSSTTSPVGVNNRRGNKTHVPSACYNCKKAHLACDTSRPCKRCVTLRKQDNCYDIKHKKRGRPKLIKDEKISRLSSSVVETKYVQNVNSNSPIFTSGISSRKCSLTHINCGDKDSNGLPILPVPSFTVWASFDNITCSNVSDECLQLIGYSPEELNQHSLFDYVHLHDRNKMSRVVEKLINLINSKYPNHAFKPSEAISCFSSKFKTFNLQNKKLLSIAPGCEIISDNLRLKTKNDSYDNAYIVKAYIGGALGADLSRRETLIHAYLVINLSKVILELDTYKSTTNNSNETYISSSPSSSSVSPTSTGHQSFSPQEGNFNITNLNSNSNYRMNQTERCPVLAHSSIISRYNQDISLSNPSYPLPSSTQNSISRFSTSLTYPLNSTQSKYPTSNSNSNSNSYQTHYRYPSSNVQEYGTSHQLSLPHIGNYYDSKYVRNGIYSNVYPTLLPAPLHTPPSKMGEKSHSSPAITSSANFPH